MILLFSFDLFGQIILFYIKETNLGIFLEFWELPCGGRVYFHLLSEKCPPIILDKMLLFLHTIIWLLLLHTTILLLLLNTIILPVLLHTSISLDQLHPKISPVLINTFITLYCFTSSSHLTLNILLHTIISLVLLPTIISPAVITSCQTLWFQLSCFPSSSALLLLYIPIRFAPLHTVI